jgi:hypothetical protein
MTTLVCLVGWWYGALPLMAVGAVYAVRGGHDGDGTASAAQSTVTPAS